MEHFNHHLTMGSKMKSPGVFFFGYFFHFDTKKLIKELEGSIRVGH